MTTNNRTAAYIASKPITKHMSLHAANAIWRDLRAEGWTADLGTPAAPMLTKHDEQGPQRFFTFVKVVETKAKVSYMELEVAS